ncbi:MAG: hypothetical protein Q8R60_05790 [Mycobacteriales bacterium]|nr:hypothetical protein [Mycobacteriales bacterium]
MAPIDDELRSTLSGRADLVSPAADPFEGIERRARGIRRRRGLAAVLGTTAAVAAIALAVPAMIGGTTPTTAPQDFATPTTTGDRPTNALDWPSVSGSTALDSDARAEWGRVHAASDASGEVLFRGRTADDREVVLLQIWAPEGKAHAVIATTGEEAPLLLLDQVAEPTIDGYRAIVPGIETPHVVVVGAPGTNSIDYAADGRTFRLVATGRSAVFRRTGPTGPLQDQIRVDDGSFVYAQPADPDASDRASADVPSNLLAAWPERGERPDEDLVIGAKRGFAMAVDRGSDISAARFVAHFAGSTDGGLRYVLGQAWFVGEDTAYPVSFTLGGESGQEVFVGRPTADNAQVLAFVPCCSPGTTTDTLVVIPAPGAGQVQYGAANSEWRDVGAGQDYLDGVVLVDRDPGATDDRLRILDGDGNLDGPYLYEGPVAALLCGIKECG